MRINYFLSYCILIFTQFIANQCQSQCVEQNPDVFPVNTWRCDVFGDLNFVDYQGYYFRDSWSFQTTSDWTWDSSPSNASGYVGCEVANDNHTISVKRTGFSNNPDGYQIQMNQWDDDAYVLIDGQQVWSSGCCASGINNVVWEGDLNELSTVEVRMREYGGASFLGFTLVELCSNPSTFFLDSDLDGFGNTNEPVSLCSLVSGYVINDLDCNDANSAINPLGTEQNCNDLDDNCNGEIDEGFSFQDLPFKWMIRAFNDITFSDLAGYYSRTGLGVHTLNDWVSDASPSSAQGWIGCGVNTDWHSYTIERTGFTNSPAGYTLYMNDWDDDVQCFIDGSLIWSSGCCAWNGNLPIWSGQLNANTNVIFKLVEYGGGSNLGFTFVDNSSGCADQTACNYNPNANSDDGSCYYATYYYQDLDEDGEGNFTVSTTSCTPVSGYVTNFLDCNDDSSEISASATETCNELDDNCNNLIDEDLEVFIFYTDLDNDGFGAGAGISSCILPLNGVSMNDYDCNDSDEFVNQNAEEIGGNGIDEDCDGQIDNLVLEELEVFSLAPNPAYESIRVLVSPSEIGKFYSIHDIVGKCIQTSTISSLSFEIDLTNFGKGSYLISIQEKSCLFEVLK